MTLENKELGENSSSILNEETPPKKVEPKKTVITASYSGPIPPSSELARYEQIVPGSGLRIIEMAEKQSSHRQFIEGKILDSNTSLANREADERKRGQIFAFIIAMSSIILGAILLILNKTVMGSIFSGGGLASILLVFYSSNISWFKKKK